MAEVSALGSTLMPPLTKAGYKPEDYGLADRRRHRDGHAGAARIFMIVIAQVTNTRRWPCSWRASCRPPPSWSA